MSDTITPGRLAILIALRHHEGGALDVRKHLEDAGVEVPLMIYSALRGLVCDGLLDVREVPGGPERGGRPKSLYRLTEKSRALLARVWS